MDEDEQRPDHARPLLAAIERALTSSIEQAQTITSEDVARMGLPLTAGEWVDVKAESARYVEHLRVINRSAA